MVQFAVAAAAAVVAVAVAEYSEFVLTYSDLVDFELDDVQFEWAADAVDLVTSV